MYTNEQLIEFCQEAVRIPSYSDQQSEEHTSELQSPR